MAESSSSLVDRYCDAVCGLVERFRAAQGDALCAAAVAVADAIAGGGVVHLFGTGHSHMLAEEVFYRAGGLVPMNPMLDPSVLLSAGALRSTETERTSGAAAAIAARYDLRSGDAGVVISNSGRNPAPVEMARLMRERGLAVIAVTSVAHSRAMPRLDPPGARLFEVANFVLDTGGSPGDAFLSHPSVPYPLGPTSTAIGAVIVQSLVLAAVETLVARGATVVNLPSGNVAAADPAAALAELSRYKARLRHL